MISDAAERRGLPLRRGQHPARQRQGHRRPPALPGARGRARARRALLGHLRRAARRTGLRRLPRRPPALPRRVPLRLAPARRLDLPRQIPLREPALPELARRDRALPAMGAGRHPLGRGRGFSAVQGRAFRTLRGRRGEHPHLHPQGAGVGRRGASLPGAPLRDGRRQAQNPRGDERDLGARLTTVFPRQGHYALDPAETAKYPPADLTVERMATCSTTTWPTRVRRRRRRADTSPYELPAGWEAESLGRFHKVGEGAGRHLLHHPAPVRLHRYLADAEPETDLLVQEAGDHQRHHLTFASGE